MYITLSLGSYTIHHGYDENNKEIVEKVEAEGYTKKIVQIERILSLTDKTVLISSAYGREIYWEYEGDLEKIRQKLINAGLLIH